jgi:uncharacterized protein YciI
MTAAQSARADRYGRRMPTPHQVLLYDYVENALEARAPHRDAHLALIQRYTADGRVTIAGALGDPPHGGLIVFAGDDPSVAEGFAAEDPYVSEGVVTRWRVEPWTVVT